MGSLLKHVQLREEGGREGGGGRKTLAPKEQVNVRTATASSQSKRIIALCFAQFEPSSSLYISPSSIRTLASGSTFIVCLPAATFIATCVCVVFVSFIFELVAVSWKRGFTSKRQLLAS